MKEIKIFLHEDDEEEKLYNYMKGFFKPGLIEVELDKDSGIIIIKSITDTITNDHIDTMLSAARVVDVRFGVKSII